MKVPREPPLEPSPERVPVTEAHRKGVVDPMSAAIMPVAGKGEMLAPEACKRKLAIFDGRNRVDIDLVYKRVDQAKADKGYQGPVVVYTVLYNPIAGHRPERDAIKYLIAQRDMEMWLAPIAVRACWCRSASRCRRRSGSGCCRRVTSSAHPDEPGRGARRTPVRRSSAHSSSLRVFLQARERNARR